MMRDIRYTPLRSNALHERALETCHFDGVKFYIDSGVIASQSIKLIMLSMTSKNRDHEYI